MHPSFHLRATFARRIAAAMFACALALAGCLPARPKPRVPTVDLPFSRYTAADVDWSTLQRVVLMPLDNRTQHPDASRQIQTALAAELQRIGRFDVVIGSPETYAHWSRSVLGSGRFDEFELLQTARKYQAQALLFGAVTQYEPYAPPQIGLSLLLVSPAQATVIGSVDGLWDARETAVAELARRFHRNTLRWPQNLFGSELALESPGIYQRFVANQAARALSDVPKTPAAPTPQTNATAAPGTPAADPRPSPAFEETPLRTQPRDAAPREPGYQNALGVRFDDRPRESPVAPATFVRPEPVPQSSHVEPPRRRPQVDDDRPTPTNGLGVRFEPSFADPVVAPPPVVVEK